MTIKTVDLNKSFEESLKDKYKGRLETIIRKRLREIAYLYLKESLKSPQEIDDKMGVSGEIEFVIDRELKDYREYLIRKFYKDNYRNIMFVAKNYDF